MFVCLLCGANPDWQSKNYSQAILTDFLFGWQPPEKSDWGTGLEAMQSALELEKHVNQALLDLHKIADSHGDAQMCDFIEAMAPRLEAIAPMYVADPRPNGGSMFRIYRDVRFSRDPKPYKEHAACQLRHQAGRDAHAPGYYVHLALDGVRFGGGIYLPPAPILTKIRHAIDEKDANWNADRKSVV